MPVILLTNHYEGITNNIVRRAVLEGLRLLSFDVVSKEGLIKPYQDGR